MDNKDYSLPEIEIKNLETVEATNEVLIEDELGLLEIPEDIFSDAFEESEDKWFSGMGAEELCFKKSPEEETQSEENASEIDVQATTKTQDAVSEKQEQEESDERFEALMSIDYKPVLSALEQEKRTFQESMYSVQRQQSHQSFLPSDFNWPECSKAKKESKGFASEKKASNDTARISLRRCCNQKSKVSPFNKDTVHTTKPVTRKKPLQTNSPARKQNSEKRPVASKAVRMSQTMNSGLKSLKTNLSMEDKLTTNPNSFYSMEEKPSTNSRSFYSMEEKPSSNPNSFYCWDFGSSESESNCSKQADSLQSLELQLKQHNPKAENKKQSDNSLQTYGLDKKVKKTSNKFEKKGPKGSMKIDLNLSKVSHNNRPTSLKGTLEDGYMKNDMMNNDIMGKNSTKNENMMEDSRMTKKIRGGRL